MPGDSGNCPRLDHSRRIGSPVAKKRYSKFQHKNRIDPYYDTAAWRELRWDCLVRDLSICQYCGARAHQADHVIPRRKGGQDALDNLVAACRDCNYAALGTKFETFADKKKYVLAQRRITRTIQAPPMSVPQGKCPYPKPAYVAPPEPEPSLFKKKMAERLAKKAA